MEIPYTACTSKKAALHARGQLIVRMVRRLDCAAVPDGRSELLAAHRRRAFHTTNPLVIDQRRLAQLTKAAADGYERAVLERCPVLSELAVLRGLAGPAALEDETAELKRVRQSGHYRVWRVRDPYYPSVACG